MSAISLLADQYGMSPQRSVPMTRSPLSGWRRITGNSWPGAALQWGGKFEVGPGIWKSRRIASGAVMIAYLPHMPIPRLGLIPSDQRVTFSP